MIGYLQGIARHPDIVVCAGVGYRVTTPEPLADAEPVELHVVTIVREDALELFGFATAAEESLFRVLIKASGVGPKLAVGLIAGLGASAVAHAIASGDHKTLATCKGVGAKLAQTLSATVTIPADLLLALGAAPEAATPDEEPVELDDVAAALVELGFDNTRALDAAAAARAARPELTDDGALVRVALTKIA